jgi:hypothetical protein
VTEYEYTIEKFKTNFKRYKSLDDEKIGVSVSGLMEAGFLRGNFLQSDLAENFSEDVERIVESILKLSDFFVFYS